MEIKKVLNPNSISMKLMISSLFVEPGFYFNVSSNVRELISKEISPLLTQSILFTKRYDQYDLGLIISTKKGLEDLKVQGPEVDKNLKSVDYVLWMPYEKIAYSATPLMNYLHFLFDGLIEVLTILQFDTVRIKQVLSNIQNEVLNNPIYTYTEGTNSIDDIINELEI